MDFGQNPPSIFKGMAILCQQKWYYAGKILLPVFQSDFQLFDKNSGANFTTDLVLSERNKVLIPHKQWV